MSNIPTAHISSAKGDFARTVLMPGDPAQQIHRRELPEKRAWSTMCAAFKVIPASTRASRFRDGLRHGHAHDGHLFL